jgi:DNA topoisomerase-3
MLKSAELTGIWEKRLREIERGKYRPAQFIDELKQMVATLVQDVLADNTSRL